MKSLKIKSNPYSLPAHALKVFIVVLFIIALQACSDNGGKSPSTNLAPNADAGQDQSANPFSSVELDGSASTDEDGYISSYQWVQTSGPSVVLDSADSAITTFTVPDPDVDTTLSFDLTVTDSSNDQATDSVDIFVNAAPRAIAGPDQSVTENTLIVLDGSQSSDPGGTDIAQFAWTQTSGPAVQLTNADSDVATFTAPAGVTDTLTFKLTVYDENSASGGDELNIYVRNTIFSDDFTSAANWSIVDDVAGRSSDWQISAGEYVQQEYVESTNAFDGSYRLGTYAYLNSQPAWNDFWFSVDITPLVDPGTPSEVSQGNDIGVMFRYNHNADIAQRGFYRLALNGRYGFTRLEKKTAGGGISTLAVNSRGYEQDGDAATVRITVEATGSMILVSVNDDPVFSVQDSTIASGGIALYCQDRAKFDNVVVTDSPLAPNIVISTPYAHSVTTGQNLNVAAAVLNLPSGGSVDLILDDSDTVTGNLSDNLYVGQFLNVSQGNHIVAAVLRDSYGTEIIRDTNEMIGVRGDYHITLGNSITNGDFDDDSGDNRSDDDRQISFQGYQPELNNFLSNTLSQPNIVFNEGIGGDKAADTLNRLSSFIERHPQSNKVLLMLGTNDSGEAISSNVFKTNMQAIVNTLAGPPNNKEVWVALIPPVFSNLAAGTLDEARNNIIISYNSEIQTLTSCSIGPDFFDFFENRSKLFYDNLHPNGLGYEAMSYLWHNALNPGDPLTLPGYLLNP
jgi:lysophospholipase L1-like esterase